MRARRQLSIVAVLYLLPPAPAVMSSPYGEPLFALLTFGGYELALRGYYFPAALLLAGATSIRATGALAAGVFGWLILLRGAHPRALLRPWTLIHRVPSAIVCSSIVIAPFIASQAYWHRQLCQLNDLRGEWCDRPIPLIYTHVQEKYWNVGLLNYWTIEQIPNLLLAAPILVTSLIGTYRFFIGKAARTQLVPFYILHAALTLLLALSAHSQIALRVCVTDPAVWWTVADLGYDDGRVTRFGRVWIAWTVVFGAISIVLWAGHYPPA